MIDRVKEGPFLTLRDELAANHAGRWQIRLDVHQSLRNSPAASTDSIVPPRTCSFDTVRSIELEEFNWTRPN